MTLPSSLEIERRVKNLAPDYKQTELVISTHPLIHPTYGKQRLMVLLDPIVHAAYCVTPKAHYYLAFWKGTESLAERFGLARKKVIYTGPLARPIFYESAKRIGQTSYKAECKKELGIPAGTTLALVMAGQAWMYRAEDYLDYLKTEFKASKIIFAFMCGRNVDFAHKLTTTYGQVKQFKVLTWLDQEEVAKWMAAADFGVAFSLAQMCVEAGLSRLPIYIFKLIEGQEEGYRGVVEERGVGMFVPGEPKNQVQMLKLLWPYTQAMFGKNLDLWQKELMAVPKKLRLTLDELID